MNSTVRLLPDLRRRSGKLGSSKKYFFRNELEMGCLVSHVILSGVRLLPLHLRKVLAVHSFSTLPVGLVGAKVNGPFGQDPLLHDPSSLVESGLFYVVLEVIHMGADTDFITRGVLDTHVLSACVSGEEPCF